MGALIAVWSAAFSGWQIQSLPIPLMAVHLLSSLAGLVVIAYFLQMHWWQRRHSLARHVNAPWGLAALTCLLSLVLSGSALLHWTNVPWLQHLHAGMAVLLLGVLTFHIAWRLRSWLARSWQNFCLARTLQQTQLQTRPFSGGQALRRWLLSAGSVALLFLPAAGAGAFALNRPQPGREILVAHASLQERSLPSSGDCAACHADLASQWSKSTHAHAATDPYYQSLAAMFVQERGVEALRYCAACHTPIGLIQGEVVHPAEQTSTAAETTTQAYAARTLGVQLQTSPEAAEGVSCAVCHLAAAVNPTQNAGLSLEVSGDLPGASLPRLALRSAPEDHRRQVRQTALDEAALCGSCHNLRSPDGLLLEPTYQEWVDSPYPAQGKSCQSCHFPPAQARLANSSPLAAPAAHGGFPGAPSSLSGVSMGTDLLRQAAQLSLQVAPGKGTGELVVTVTVTNTGAGHFLPTGADDLRQVWLELSLLDDQGRLLWQSGGLDSYGELMPGSVRFRKVLGDAGGRPIDLHRFWIATQILEDTRLAPLESRQISFTVSLPVSISEQARLSARLLYRDVSPTFAAFALGKPVPDLTVFEIVNQEIQIFPSNLIAER